MSWFYRVAGRFPRLLIARRNVSRAKARSILAAAAILIGVVAIGSIGAGGAAFKQSQLQTLDDQGATNVFVAPGLDKEERHFDREDIKAIEEVVGPAGVVATKSRDMEMTQRGDRRESVSVTFMDDPRLLYEIRFGTLPDPWRRSAVLSNGFAAEHGLSPGDRVTLVRTVETAEGDVQREDTYRVAAVLADSGGGFGGGDVILPIETASDRQYSQIRITTQSTDRAEAVAERLREQFNDRKDRLLVFELTSLVRLFTTIVNGINTFLAGLAAISLMVAAVSIANTMLMAVIKRREEIGVLRAVGYGRGDIVRILLAEAAMLGLAGAAVGTLLATVAAMVANSVFLGDPFAFTRSALLYLGGAAGFGVVTSLVAGAYPAWRAANERPVEALRG